MSESWIAAAGLAWEWTGAPGFPKSTRPDIVGPFPSESDAIAYLREEWPVLNDQHKERDGYVPSPDSDYEPYVTELVTPDHFVQLTFDTSAEGDAPNGVSVETVLEIAQDLKDKADGA